jgi:adenosylcobinamide-phosphate synthase
MMSAPTMVLAACILDLIAGDPAGYPHPVILMGKLISKLENLARRTVRTPAGKRVAGFWMTLFLVLLSYGVTFGLIRISFVLHPWAGWGVSVLLAYATLAARCLQKEASRILRDLHEDDLVSARRHLAGIVGRETSHLSEVEVIRATVETVAENTSDGVVAPLFYLLVGGPPLAMAYKAVNTLDSMVGYKAERFRDLGLFPARLDDVLNYIPARITGLLMVIASFFLLESVQLRHAFGIMVRDGRKHPSPNAGIPEAAAAGALNVQLGGVNIYEGIRNEKPVIGDPLRPLSPDSIAGAVRLMYGAFFLMFLLGVLVHIL